MVGENIIKAIVIAMICGGLPALGYADEGDEDNTNNNKVEISTGFDRTSGMYGTNQVATSTSIPVALSYDTDNYQYAVTVPYLMQAGPAGMIGGRRVRPIFGSHKVVKASGLGDVTGALTRHLVDDEETGISVDIQGIVKFATASQKKGLGTGKNDYSVETDISKSFDKLGLSGSLGYSALGSPGSIVVSGVQLNVAFHNVFYGSVGSTYELTDATQAGLTLNKEQAAEQGGFQQRDLTADLDYKFTKYTKLGFYILRGLAKGSPAWGSGASISASF